MIYCDLVELWTWVKRRSPQIGAVQCTGEVYGCWFSHWQLFLYFNSTIFVYLYNVVCFFSRIVQFSVNILACKDNLIFYYIVMVNGETVFTSCVLVRILLFSQSGGFLATDYSSSLQESNTSKTHCCRFFVHIISLSTWCALSKMAFTCGFFIVVGVGLMWKSLNEDKKSFFTSFSLSKIIFAVLSDVLSIYY